MENGETRDDLMLRTFVQIGEATEEDKRRTAGAFDSRPPERTSPRWTRLPHTLADR